MSENEQWIVQALSKLFDRHRIVFWYDAEHELRNEFEALELAGVEKVEIINNEYGLKYRMLREKPKQKFLVYKDRKPPLDAENWLLDVQLAHGTFRTDQVTLWLADLELSMEFKEVVKDHKEFFQSVKRKEAFKKLLKSDDTTVQIRFKMLAVCVGNSRDARMDAILENLLQELADKREDKINLIRRCSLDRFFWEQVERCYGYSSKEANIKDFAIELFKSCYAMETNGTVKLTGEALVFLKRWKDSRQFENSFETLSGDCAEVLGIEQDLAKRDFKELMELDYFRLIDQKILSDMVLAVVNRTVSSDEVSLWVRQRRQCHWYGEYQHLYEAVDYGAQFMHTLGEVNLSMESLTDGVQQYSRSWYRIDQFYRKFTYHVRVSGQPSLMSTLTDQIENLYSNNFLLKLGDHFQTFVDGASQWEALPVPIQRDFFAKRVQPFLRKENKICVIISDAMRYEIGKELLSLIRQEDRYSAELEPALSMLPSYTQLGMAALLPNKNLAIADNESGTVLVDGRSSQGTANRIKILGQAEGARATACKADEMMAMNRDDCRSLVRDHDVIYIYHNLIDATGDKRESEERVFEAVEKTLKELILLIKKLNNANLYNFFVTADHGFLYQNRAIDESDFSGVEAMGEQILFRDRRFVLGKGLIKSPGLHSFTPKQLGLDGDVEVQIPKSINRLRLKGSGSRFVHGGASLQEVVIPVLKINKKRQSDVSVIEVDILRGASSVITSGQLAVTMYQAGPVTEKIQPRVLRAGIYTEAGELSELISDSHELIFDLTSNNPRDREIQVRFMLTRKADNANGQEVVLRLEEKHEGTSHYKEYKSLRYMMRRSFTSDFDF
jgi:uncharacterized protein (TIGR02687 family)